tara:strand:+ start:10130 stop:10615 length:486 start_codon:yes stop_codon:yes gene_type:complete
MDIEILANSDDNDPFPTLWDAVLVKRIEVRDESVSKSFFRILKVFQDLLESSAFVCAAKARYIFSDEPFRLLRRENLYTVCIERTVLSVETLPFTDETVVITGKTERESVDLTECTNIEIVNILMDNASASCREGRCGLDQLCVVIVFRNKDVLEIGLARV